MLENVAAPVEDIESLFVVFVAKFKVFAALKYIPLVGTVAPLGINAVAVAVLEKLALVPLNAVDKLIAPVERVIVKGVSIKEPASE